MIPVRIACIGLALAGTAAWAAQGSEARRDWRLVGRIESRGTLGYIDANSIVRSGANAEFDALLVHAEIRRTDYGTDYDNELESYQADCSSRTFQLTGALVRAGTEIVPPAWSASINDRPRPRAL